MICKAHNNCLKCCVLVLKFYTCLSSNCFVLELDMDIDVVICCVELIVIVFKFSTYELLDMDNGVDYDM